jgi:hypothetical protein
MVSAVKAKIDGMVDSPGYKWALLGAATIGLILVMPWQFANSTVFRMRAVGSVILVVTAGAGVYKVKRLWNARQAQTERSAPEKFVRGPSVAQSHRTALGGNATQNRDGGVICTNGSIERRRDPSITVTRRDGEYYEIPGGRAHPTAGGYCEENL